MNKLEARFASDWLELQRLGGEIQWWKYQPMRFRLGGSAFYKPDFVVVDATGQVIAYETKGYWREASRARIKVAAEGFPWVRFVGVRWKRGGDGWEFERFSPHG